MKRVADVLEAIEQFAPRQWSEEWDNTGLLAGNVCWRVDRVAVALDATIDTMSKARENGCNCLLTHHPLVFEPLRKLDCATPTGRKIELAMEWKMSVIAAHTNWDKAPLGVNVILAGLLGLQNPQSLVPAAEGLFDGCRGDLPAEMTNEALGDLVRRKWGIAKTEIHAGCKPRLLRRVALCGGSGGSLWPEALAAGADVFVTADMKYHQILEAVESGLAIVSVDHGEMESVSLDDLAGLTHKFSGLECLVVTDQSTCRRI
ncbi:MAG: Nif3-like dinuclear metal center hexameric protein [Synergistota bacterium]|nr:Nif3-like dinuclear metal center hexameric protein [Synergistota bacterium]